MYRVAWWLSSKKAKIGAHIATKMTQCGIAEVRPLRYNSEV
jgi:hypothetical protein